MEYIGIEGFKIKAPIGVYDWEKENGRDYIVDIQIQMTEGFENIGDDIEKTINYEKLITIVKENMQKPQNLIEHAANQIKQSILEQFDQISMLKLRIKKIKPIPNLELEFSYAETNFIK